jgi:hypothetical protein
VGVAEKACTLSVERIARFLAADLRQRKCDLDAAVTLPECGQEHVFAAAIAAICKCQSRLELHLCRGITERTRDVPGEARVFKTRECADDMTANFGIGIVKHRDEQRGRLLGNELGDARDGLEADLWMGTREGMRERGYDRRAS